MSVEKWRSEIPKKNEAMNGQNEVNNWLVALFNGEWNDNSAKNSLVLFIQVEIQCAPEEQSNEKNGSEWRTERWKWNKWTDRKSIWRDESKRKNTNDERS